MPSPIEGLEPSSVWRYFEEVCRIPRGSGDEKRIAQYVLDEAARLKLEAKRDHAGNVLVRKAATKGQEKRRSVCLQCHLDMVCEKNKTVVHDFKNDPIKLRREGEWVYATGTTLGADNGIAIAVCLALMADSSAVHGPLELFFTVDEEEGMTGVKEMSADLLSSRVMINLDSEDDGVFFIGCAGGLDTVITFPARTVEPAKGHVPVQIEVTGLKGGHSGLDIAHERASACKMLGRVLREVSRTVKFGVARLRAGNKRNAIAREGEAVVWIAPTDRDALERALKAVEGTLRSEYRLRDPGLTLAVAPVSPAPERKVFEEGDQQRVLALIHALPHGVCAMSKAVPGLVETSTNLGVIDTTEGGVRFVSLTRSSVESAKLAVVDSIRAAGELAGAQVSAEGNYNGWDPNPESPLLGTAKQLYFRLFNQEAQVAAIHAGLECAIIGGKYPGMDMISYGPTLQSVHSPDERMKVDTVPRFWKLTLELIKAID